MWSTLRPTLVPWAARTPQQFGAVRPVATMVRVSALVHAGMLVEVKVVALATGGRLCGLTRPPPTAGRTKWSHRVWHSRAAR